MSNEHIVKSFAQELQRLSNLITQMGGVAEAQVEAAVQALVRRDTAIASQVSSRISASTTMNGKSITRRCACWRSASRWRPTCGRSSPR